MVLTVEQRTKKATAARKRHAQTRRFRRYLAEMRGSGLEVVVFAARDSTRLHPDYTIGAVEKAAH